jgi:hypothetical protein
MPSSSLKNMLSRYNPVLIARLKMQPRYAVGIEYMIPSIFSMKIAREATPSFL